MSGEGSRKAQTGTGVEQEEALAEFRRVHRRLSQRVEGFLMQAIVWVLVTLVLAQTLASHDLLRRHMPFTPAEALEGIPFNEVAAWSDTYGAERAHLTSRSVTAAATARAFTVTVSSLESRAAGVQLLVDGVPAGDFSAGEVQVAVNPGQRIDIDARGVGIPLRFRVVGNGELRAPRLGQEVTTRGNLVTLGTVQER